MKMDYKKGFEKLCELFFEDGIFDAIGCPNDQGLNVDHDCDSIAGNSDCIECWKKSLEEYMKL